MHFSLQGTGGLRANKWRRAGVSTHQANMKVKFLPFILCMQYDVRLAWSVPYANEYLIHEKST